MRLLTILFLGILGCATLLGAGDFNRNGGMELGVLGGPVPGFKLESTYISRQMAEKDPERLYFPTTVEGGNPGRCLRVEGDYGYRMELEDFYIRQDCEVEISFDAKAAPGKDGQFYPLKDYRIDFRCNPDGVREKYYPMLEGLTFKPGKEWKHFSRRFKIKARANFYSIWVLPPSPYPNNALLLDNFRFRRVDVPEVPANEYAVNFQHVESAYQHGDTVEAVIRAQLNSARPEISGTARLAFHHNGEKISGYPVTFKRGADNLYEGRVAFKAEKFGSLSLALELPEVPDLKRIGGDFVVLHPRVHHPRFSPGWSLGSNVSGVNSTRNSDLNENLMMRYSGSYDRDFRILSQAGLGIGRVWNYWRAVEPEPGKYTGTPVICKLLDMLEKYRIEPVLCVVSAMNVGKGLNEFSGFPRHLQKYYHPTPDNREGCLMLPLDTVWKPYLQHIVGLWKHRVKIWELGNEPGLLRIPPDGYVKWYTDYCRFSAKEIKAMQPDAIVLGNGVTGDFGMNMVGWCKQLNDADPDYCKEIDGIAFHPYNCGLDYMDGRYFPLRDTTRDISASLKHPRPLWNTEDYYLHTAYRKQLNFYLNKERYGANEIARAYIDSLLDGVKADMGPSCNSWFQQNNVNGLCPPSECTAAANAFSFLLKDMVKTEELNCGKMTRAALFSDRDGKTALGAVYDMRPSGSNWRFTPSPEVQVMDIYGNGIKAPVLLKFEPCYLRGDAAAVRKLLLTSKFEATTPVRITGRKMGGRLFLCGENLTGIPENVEVETAGVTVQFDFRRDIRYCTVELPEKLVSRYTGKLAPEAVNGGKLPYTAQLSDGSVVKLTVGKEQLIIDGTLKTPKIVQAEQDLYSGTSLEVFIDNAPFRDLERNNGGMQYVFAPLASKTSGKQVQRLKGNTAATVQTALASGGWTLHAEIPLSELRIENFAGVALELNHDGGQPKVKSFPGADESFRKRFHYPVIEFFPDNSVPNGAMEQTAFGLVPELWNYCLPGGAQMSCQAEPEIGGNCFTVSLPKPHTSFTGLKHTAKFAPGIWRHGVLTALIKIDQLKRHAKEGGFAAALNFKRGSSKCPEFNLRLEDGKCGWKLVHYPFLVPEITDYLTLRLGLDPQTSGTMQIASVKLRLFK